MQEIFANASSFIKKPATLSTLVTEIDKLDWYSARQEGLGDLYEGLLEKNANEKKSGAGQYFTPRPLIDCMVAVMKPTLDDIIQDPAAGTGGFLIAANHYIREHRRLRSPRPKPSSASTARSTFYGMEHVQDTHRLALMNLMLHGIDPTRAAGIRYGDTLSRRGRGPAQGRRSSSPTRPSAPRRAAGCPPATDFTFPTSNKQFCFLQHIYRGLKPGGRAAVVLPDNVLFEGNVGKQTSARDLMDKCNLHTILRLPTGIFYAQGVKTNVLFFTRGEKDKGNTKEVWVYDLRANMPAIRQAHRAHPRALRRVRGGLRRRSAGRPRGPGHTRGHRRGRPLPQVHPRVDRRARRQPRHLLAQGRERGHRRRPARARRPRPGGHGRAGGGTGGAARDPGGAG